MRGGGVSGNYIDIETGEKYWVSGIKKNGKDRHWAGSGPVLIEREAIEEYLLIRGLSELDLKSYQVTDSIVQTNIDKFKKIENHGDWNFEMEGDI